MARASAPPCVRLLAWFREGIARDFGEKSAAFVKHETTFQDLAAESLDRVEWRAEAEERFGATMSDREAESLRTVGDFLRSIRAHARRPIEP
jgi:acyl carrier protein